ncbi:hypothetical protein Ae201684P_022454 [Aphanomyces euteiches]|nr:hypothetical protein Ae201684P_022454 [Aphanomyces euteiches]KAH9154159.1 hypothetical protein AeRB84_003707 [Aphanomyces euteiches]
MQPAFLLVSTLALMAAPVASNSQCDPYALLPLFQPVMTSAAQCQTAAGYTFLPPEVAPTQDNIAAICAAPECKPLLPVFAQVPSCSLEDIDFGAFASAVVAKCGNSTTSTPSVDSAAWALTASASSLLVIFALLSL